METWVIADGGTADTKGSSGQLTTFQTSNWRREQRTARWAIGGTAKAAGGRLAEGRRRHLLVWRKQANRRRVSDRWEHLRRPRGLAFCCCVLCLGLAAGLNGKV